MRGKRHDNWTLVLKYPECFVDNDFDKIAILTKRVLSNAPFNKIKNGFCLLDIYFNDYYGILFDIKYINKDSNRFDVKIVIHVDSIFLFKMDYFDVKNKDIKGNIYFYNNDFYFEPLEKLGIINSKDFFEYGEIVYGDWGLEVINNGIKVI